MIVRWIAWRVIAEFLRDRRTMAFFLLVPLVVMTLIYYAISEDELARLAIVARGPARFFEYDLEKAVLEENDDIEIVTLAIPDEEIDPARLVEAIRAGLREGAADGVLYLDEHLLTDRFNGRRGTLRIFVEGSRPTVTAAILSSISAAMDELASSLPLVIDAECPGFCANSVNMKPMELERIYLHGSDDLRLIDFFLPVFPPFFVFFFTFLIATVTFQRERVRGTLERLLVAPVSFIQIVVGYLMGFFVFSGVQAVIIVSFLLAMIGYPLNAWQIVDLAILTAIMMLIALLFGLLASFLAHNEFQAIQFVPLVILPQVFLSDMIWDIRGFPVVFQWISTVLPLTHANAAMRNVLLKNQFLYQSWPQLAALGVLFAVVVLLLVAMGSRLRED